MVGGYHHAPATLPLHEAGWAPKPVWMGAGYLAPTEIRSPDRPARSESLYRLTYPGPSTRRMHEKVRNLKQFLVAIPQKKKLVP
jgi:hypothetical protein